MEYLREGGEDRGGERGRGDIEEGGEGEIEEGGEGGER